MPTVDASGRLIFAEGHDPRVLRVIATMAREQVAVCIAVGQRAEIEKQLASSGIELMPGPYFEIAEPGDQLQFFDQWLAFQSAKQQRWEVENLPAFLRDSRNTAYAARIVAAGDANSMICGLSGNFAWHFVQLREAMPGLQHHAVGVLRLLLSSEHAVGLVHSVGDNSSADIAGLAIAAIRQTRGLNFSPSIMLCQDSYWKNVISQAEALGKAAAVVKALDPEADIHAPIALAEAMQSWQSPQRNARADCTILVLSRAETAQMVREALISESEWLDVGSFLLGAKNRSHILNSDTSVDTLARFSRYVIAASRPERTIETEDRQRNLR